MTAIWSGKTREAIHPLSVHEAEYEVSITQGDLDDEVYEAFLTSSKLALDCETTGLDPTSSELRLIQLCDEHGRVALVQRPKPTPSKLLHLIQRQDCRVIIHFARFDVSFVYRHLQVIPRGVVCTKIAARLVLGVNTDSSLGAVLDSVLGVRLDKDPRIQQSGWSGVDLSADQIQYAAADVAHLIPLWEELRVRLVSSGILPLALECFDAAVVEGKTDALGYPNLFLHS